MKCHFAASFSPEIARPPCLLSARITISNFSKKKERTHRHVANNNDNNDDTRTLTETHVIAGHTLILLKRPWQRRLFPSVCGSVTGKKTSGWAHAVFRSSHGHPSKCSRQPENSTRSRKKNWGTRTSLGKNIWCCPSKIKEKKETKQQREEQHVDLVTKSVGSLKFFRWWRVQS